MRVAAIRADTIVSEQYGDTNGNTVATLDYSADNYAALDQFGRVLTQDWTGSSGSSVLDGYVYQYSAAGNVTGITNLTRTQGGADTANSYDYYSTDRLWAENQGSTGTYSNADVYDSAGNTAYYEWLYYLNDANFNVTALVGKVGAAWAVIEHYAYDPYGNVTVYDPTWATVRASGSSYSNTVLFAGCALDPLSGLYQMGARYYDPALGRFISRDPTGYAGSGINLYAYCGDNPLVYTDPTGLCRDRGWNAEANKPYTTWDIIWGAASAGADTLTSEARAVNHFINANALTIVFTVTSVTIAFAASPVIGAAVVGGLLVYGLGMAVCNRIAAGQSGWQLFLSVFDTVGITSVYESVRRL